MWDFLKKFKKTEPEQAAAPAAPPAAEKPAPIAPPAAERSAHTAAPAAVVPIKVQTPPQTAPAQKAEKPHAQKTDEELAEELNKMSPEILSQAKTPQMRKMVIDLYRKMLVAGVDVEDEKAVKKWMQKHPEAVNGGEVHTVATVKRAGPKIGRNDPCVCGSGKKYKKCCGAKEG
jgi:hypothetical protein